MVHPAPGQHGTNAWGDGVDAALAAARPVTLSGPGIDLTGASDSWAAVQAILTANPDRTIRGVPGSTYTLSNTLTVRSGQHLDLHGTSLSWVGTAAEMIVNTACSTPQRTVTDATTTAGSATIGSASASFTLADIGRAVTISGAGPGGYNLCGNIITVTSATVAVLDTAAIATTSAESLSIYNRDTDISIVGGTLVRDSTATTGHSVMIRRADRVNISPTRMEQTTGLYAIDFGHCTAFAAENVSMDVCRDGVHVNGPADNGLIQGITGISSDDLVSLTGHDAAGGGYGTYCVDTCGDIKNVVVKSSHKDGGWGGIVRVLAGQQCKLRDVVVDGVSGNPAGSPLVFMSDFPIMSASLAGSDMSDITVKNVAGTPGAGRALVEIDGPGFGIVKLDILQLSDALEGSSAVLVKSGTSGATLDLTLTNITSGTAPVLDVQTGATWKSLTSGALPGFGGNAQIVPGGYYGPGPHIPGQGVQPSGQASAIPFWVPAVFTADRIACEVVTAAAGSTVSLAIYASNSAGEPGALLLDAGAVDSATTGVKEAVVSHLFVPGLYWLAALPAGGSPTLRTVGATSAAAVPNMAFNGPFGINGWYMLSSTFVSPWHGTSAGECVKTMVRASLVYDRDRDSLVNVVTNPDFADGATGWDLGAGWSVAGGAAVSASATTYLIQGNVFADITHKFYISFDVTAYTSGVVGLLGAHYDNPQNFSGLGHKSCVETPKTLHLWLSSGIFNGSLDNWVIADLTALFGAGNELTAAQIDSGTW